MSTTIPERLTTKSHAAVHLHVSESTIKNWLRPGLITGSRFRRSVVVDLDEIAHMLATSPPRGGSCWEAAHRRTHGSSPSAGRRLD